MKRVLLTHGHHDHYGLAEKVADASGATLYGGTARPGKLPAGAQPQAPPRGHVALGLRARWRASRSSLSVAGVDHFAKPLEAWDELSGGETLPGDGWSVVVRSTPGPHARQPHVRGPGGRRPLHGRHRAEGDHAERGRGRGPRGVRAALSAASRATSRRSTRWTARRETRRCSRGTARRSRTGPRIARRSTGATASASDRSSASSRRGPATVRDLVAAIFPRVKTLNVFLAYSEVLGFLMYLEDSGARREARLRNARPLPPRAGRVDCYFDILRRRRTARWPTKRSLPRP